MRENDIIDALSMVFSSKKMGLDKRTKLAQTYGKRVVGKYEYLHRIDVFTEKILWFPNCIVVCSGFLNLRYLKLK